MALWRTTVRYACASIESVMCRCQPVHARTSYTHEEIQFDSRFATVLTLAEDGVVEVDLRRFHETERVDSVT